MSADFLDSFERAPLGGPVSALDKGADRDTRPPKPCCARIRSPSGATSWCVLPANHRDEGFPEHHGVSWSEMPMAAISYTKGKR